MLKPFLNLLPVQWLQKAALFLLTGATWYGYFTYCFFTEAQLSSDDLTLYNPVHTFLQTGHLYYPADGFNRLIMVHPPVHYYAVAFLMKLGFNSQAAYCLPFMFWLSALLLLAVFAQLPFIKRVAIICSVQLLFFFFPVTSVRPDVPLAMAWFTSLLLFDWWRQKGNRPVLLFLSGLVLAWSSVLHYYGVFALPAAFVLGAYLIFNSSRQLRVKHLLVFTLGLAVVLAPYYLLFILPNVHVILEYVHANQTGGGIMAAIKRHIELRPYVSDLGILSYLPVSLNAAVPVAAVVFALCSRTNRLLALAVAPLIAGVLLYSTGKSMGYLMPEYLIFVFIVSYALLRACAYLLKAGFIPAKILGAVAGAALFCIILLQAIVLNTDSFGMPGQTQHKMHPVRQCAKQIVGPNAKTAGRMSAWYISGGTQWKDITNDIIRSGPLPGRDSLQKYFQRFDAIVETRHIANVALNNKRYALSSFYIDSTLNLKGLIFSSNNDYYSEVACAFYTAKKVESPKAFFVDHNQIYNIIPDSQGDFTLITAVINRKVCLLDSLQQHLGTITALNYFPLPNQASGPDQSYYDVDKDLGFMLVPRKEYEQAIPFLQTHTQLRDVINCSVKPITFGNAPAPEHADVIKYEL